MRSSIIRLLLKGYEDDRGLRQHKTDIQAEDEINLVLDAIGAKQIAIDTNMIKQINGSNLFDIMFYMILHLSKEIEGLKEGAR